MKNVNKLLYRLVAILMVCVLVSTSLLCGLLAKYSTSGSGFDSARVIKFQNLNITETGDFIDSKTNLSKPGIIVPGVDLEKKVNVVFEGSEASTYVFLKLDLNGNWTKTTNNEVDSYVIKDNDGKVMLSFTIDDTQEWEYLPDTSSPYVYYLELEPNTSINKSVIKDDGVFANESETMKGMTNEEKKEEFPTDGNYKEIYVSSKIKKSQLELLHGLSINIQAIAVQANGFENVEEAWESVKNK